MSTETTAGQLPTAKRPRKKKMSTTAKVLIWVAAGILALILIGALIVNTLFGGSSRNAAQSIPATDYTLLTSNELTNTVRVEGTVQPGTIESITTHLVTPISSISVEPGDRVELGQTIATMDTTTLSTELEAQRTSLEAQVTSASAALSAAQKAHDNYKAGIDNNTNPEILAALSAQRTANEQLTQANAAVTAATAARDAAAAAGEPTEAAAAELANAQSAQRLAAGAKSDADTGVTTARTSANTQLSTLATEVTNAQTALNSATTTRDQTLSKLQESIDSGTIKSPINGVVTSASKPGAPATGPIVTIGDDSKLTITTSVREADISKVKEGNRVTFTSGSASNKEYTGTVRYVAPIADSITQAAASGPVANTGSVGGSATAPTFTVEIEVTGDREGLYLGSKVKAQIITSEEAATLSVSRDAVYTNDAGTKAVVVAVPGESGTYTLEERAVETGLENDVDIAITGGDVQEGDMVLTNGEMYRHMVGTQVSLDAGVSGLGW